ncbi:MAG TPA: hypothetical protein VN156_04520 [Pseudomonas sp.]|nr:hypothetical protein [Pseudomonas sp.]
MFSLLSLLIPRQTDRLFALLDGDGLCRAFHRAAQAPQGSGWVEVNEQRLTWLHKPLPQSALIAPVVAHASTGKALAA